MTGKRGSPALKYSFPKLNYGMENSVYIPEGDVEVVANCTTTDVSYICVMRLQCADGEIQLFATSYNDQLYDSLQNIAKSYISEKLILHTVGEIIHSVENPPSLCDKTAHVATQTDSVNDSSAGGDMDADVAQSDLPHSDVQHSDLPHSDVQHSDLPHSDLPHSDLPHSDLPHSDLPHSDLPHSDLPHSDLPHRDLLHRDLPHSDLPHYDSTHSDLAHSDLPTDSVTNNTFEIDEKIDGMNDEEFIDFLHMSGGGNSRIEEVCDKLDIRADDLMKFVRETYHDENEVENYVALSQTEGRSVGNYADCPYKCGYCEKSFTRQSYLESHIAVMHGTIPLLDCYRCSYCDKAFKQKASLKKHFVTHIIDKPFKCRGHCNMTFGSKQQLQRHILIYKGIHQYMCKVCGKSWATKAALKGHLVVHSVVRSFQCDDCGKSFARKSQLTRHVLLHKNERKHVCSLCGKSFLRFHDLTRHSSIHEINRLRPYFCEICDKRFTKKPHLIRHRAIHYNNN